jgi:hypothetical protein
MSRLISFCRPETDITATQADFIVAQRDYRQSMRQALSEQLITVASNIGQATGNPNATMLMIEMAIDLQDFPNKDQMVDKLREIMNLPRKNETDEERQAREQAMAQKQQAEQALQDKIKELQVLKAHSEVEYNNARAAQLKAEGRRELANARNSQADATAKAAQVAQLILQNPALAPTIDDFLKNLDNIMAGSGGAEEELAKAVEPQEQAPEGELMPPEQMQEPPQDLPPQQAPEQAIDPAMLEQIQQPTNQPVPNQ